MSRSIKQKLREQETRLNLHMDRIAELSRRLSNLERALERLAPLASLYLAADDADCRSDPEEETE